MLSRKVMYSICLKRMFINCCSNYFIMKYNYYLFLITISILVINGYCFSSSSASILNFEMIDKLTNGHSGPFVNATDLLHHLQPGDIIECRRSFFSHYSLYLGSDVVLNPFLIGEMDYCKVNLDLTGIVLHQPLVQVANGNPCRINNKDISAQKLGLKARPLFKIIKKGFEWKNTPFKYNLLKSNCEHIVTTLRFGEPFSDQVINSIKLTKI